MPKLEELFAQTEGIDRVLDAETSAHGQGIPTPAENEAMGEVMLYPKAGYALTGAAVGDVISGPTSSHGGTHGYPNSDPELDGIFIANGHGIKKGVKMDRVRNPDVAPTIVWLLDIRLPTADGRPMESVLAGAK